MTKFPICLVAAAAFVAGSLFAAEPSAPAQPAPSVDAAVTPAPAEPAAPVAPAAATETVAPAVPANPAETPLPAKREPPKALDQKGKIQSLDVANGTFVVEGKSFVLAKSRKTGKITAKIFVDGVSMAFSNLKEGDLVAVTYFAKADGTNSATRVYKGHKSRKAKSKTAAAPAN